MDRTTILRLTARLYDSHDHDVIDAARALDHLLGELASLEQTLHKVAACLVIEECRHVSFDVAKTGTSCRVMVDGQERFRVLQARQIEFTYDLAAARSADHHSFTAPPMRWGDPDA